MDIQTIIALLIVAVAVAAAVVMVSKRMGGTGCGCGAACTNKHKPTEHKKDCRCKDEKPQCHCCKYAANNGNGEKSFY